MIVAIDNDLQYLKSLKLILEYMGYSIQVFDNSFEGMKYLKNNGKLVKTILIDYLMPDITGDKLIRQIYDYLAKDCYINIITGHEIKDFDFTYSGIKVKIIYKPIDLEKIIELIDTK